MKNPPIDEAVGMALAAVRQQVVVALWLSAGMVLAVAMLGLIAARRRAAALIVGAAYSASLCFVPVGHAHLLGPCGLALAVAGWLWPRRTPGDPK